MSLASIAGAIQLPPSQQFYQAVFAATPVLLQRLLTAVSTRLEGVSLFSLPYVSPSTESLVNRVLVVSALTLTLSSFFLKYRAYPANSEKRPSITDLFWSTVSITIGGLTGFWFLTSCIILSRLVQLKNTYFIHDQPNLLSRIDRVFLTAYYALKYIFLAAVAVATVLVCHKNIFNGILLMVLGKVMIQVSHPASVASDREENEIGKWISSYVASGLLFWAIWAGFGGSIVLRNGPSFISGIRTLNLQFFLSGLRGISGGFYLSAVFTDKLDHLDQITGQVAERWNSIVAKAREESRIRGVELSESHFKKTFKLVLRYIDKKTDPQKREEVILQLKELDPREREIVFLEHQPFLNPEEIKEFILTCDLQPAQLCQILSPEQIKQFVFPPHITSRLNQQGLNDISDELNELEREIPTLRSSFIDNPQLQEKYKKFIEYRSAMLPLAKVLQETNLATLRYPETKNYFQNLQGLLPQILSLKKKIAQIEGQIEKDAPDLHLPPMEALGEMKGLRERDARDILTSLARSFSMAPLLDLEQMLEEKGIKNKADLIMNEILQKQDSLDSLKIRLIVFLSIVSELRPSVSSLTEQAAQLAFKIYKYVVAPFFVALQFYLQPRWAMAGLLCGIFSLLKFSDSRIYTLFMWAISLSTPSIRHRSFVTIVEETFFQSQLTLLCTGRVGFMSAFLCGVYLPIHLVVRYELHELFS